MNFAANLVSPYLQKRRCRGHPHLQETSVEVRNLPDRLRAAGVREFPCKCISQFRLKGNTEAGWSCSLDIDFFLTMTRSDLMHLT